MEALVCLELKHNDYFVYVPSQWQTMLHCNVVSHWLSAYTKWSLLPRQWWLPVLNTLIADVMQCSCFFSDNNTHQVWCVCLAIDTEVESSNHCGLMTPLPATKANLYYTLPLNDAKGRYSARFIYHGHISLKISRKTPNSITMRARYGVMFMNTKSGQSCIIVTLVVCALSCYRWP